ncbi:unnamed protein product [Cunninghamella blakesleeana]
MSLTQKKSTVQQKTLDSSLIRTNPETNESYTLSSRCATFDETIPGRLGVPKSILDNVIFCHQEESNWPLAESSVLKKKFDEIFSSTKYTKALDNIKEIKKEKAVDIKVDHARLDSLKQDTIKSRRIKSEVEILKRKSENKLKQIENENEKLDHIVKQISELIEVYQKHEIIENKIRQTEHQKHMIMIQLQELNGALSEQHQHESDDDLKQLLEMQSSRAIDNEETREILIREKNRIEQHITTLQNNISTQLTEMGRLQASAENHQQNIQERDQLIENLCLEFNIPISSQLTTIRSIEQTIKERQDEAKKINEQSSKEQLSLSDQLQTLKSENAGLIESKRHAQRELEKEKETLKRLNSQLDSFHVTQADVDMEKDRLNNEEKRLKSHQEEILRLDADQLLIEKEKSLRDVDSQISNLNDEISKLSRQGDTRAKLALKKTDYETKTTLAKTIFEKCKNTIAEHIEKEPTLEELDKDIKSILETHTVKVSTLQSHYDQANRDFSAIEALLSSTRKAIIEKRTEVNLLSQKMKLDDDNDDTSLPEKIKQLEDKLVDTRNKHASIGAAELLYQRFTQKAEKNHQCPLCTRSFNDDNDGFNSFLHRLEVTIQRIPSQRANYAQRMENLTERIQTLKSLEGSWQQMERLNDTVSELEKTASKQEKEQSNSNKKLQEITVELNQANEDKNRLEQHYKLSEDAIRYLREADQLKDDINRLESELRRTGSTRTISDCQRELEDLTEKSKSIHREMKRLHDDRDSTFRILQQLENNVRDYKDKLTQMGYKLDTKNQVENSISLVQKNFKELTITIKDIDSKIDPISNNIDELNNLLHECRLKWNAKIEKANRAVTDIQQNIQRLESLNSKITNYENDSKNDQLESMMATKQRLETQIKLAKQKLETKVEEISKIDKELVDRKGLERELKDHIKFRSLKRDVKTCNQKLKEYRAQNEGFILTSYEQKIEVLKNKQTQLISTCGNLEGEVRQIQIQLERYQHELDNDYKEVEQRHNKQFIQVKTNEMAVNDLNKYTVALQRSIMRYHSLKMEDLNKIIKELWVSTYRGGDIDYIEIRSDNEGTAANRSFNYRVVMIKNGKEMNMRGRCSAGQKVLTSIIIRLALAETFCMHCGVLTLDEPTTNLDRDNIESLADSLTKIIQSRRSQANFQLIVITHDEEFVEYLSRSGVVEGYYRISKDENQCSVIDEFSVNEPTID